MGAIAPVFVHGHTGFPVAAVGTSGCGNIGNTLFGCFEIARQTVVDFKAQAVVENDFLRVRIFFYGFYGCILQIGIFALSHVEPDHIHGIIVQDCVQMRDNQFVYIFLLLFIGTFSSVSAVILRHPAHTAVVHPVESLRVVESDLHIFLAGGIYQSAQKIFLGGTVIRYIPSGMSIEHSQTFVVLGGNDNILHAGFFCHAHPLGGIVVLRRKVIGYLLAIYVARNLCGEHDPFGIAAVAASAGVVVDVFAVGFRSFVMTGESGITAPMDEHTEAGFSPPCHAVVSMGCRFGCFHVRCMARQRLCSGFVLRHDMKPVHRELL